MFTDAMNDSALPYFVWRSLFVMGWDTKQHTQLHNSVIPRRRKSMVLQNRQWTYKRNSEARSRYHY
jgi:hypothetical protein